MAHIGSDGDGYMPVLYISCPSLLRPLPTWGHTDVNVMDVESVMSRLRLGIAFLLPALHSQAVVLSDSTIIIIRFFCRRVPGGDG